METRSSRKKKSSDEDSVNILSTDSSLELIVRPSFNRRLWKTLNIIFNKKSKWLDGSLPIGFKLGDESKDEGTLRDLATELAWIVQSTIVQKITSILPYLNQWLDNLILFLCHNGFEYTLLLQHDYIKDIALFNDELAYSASICFEKNLFNLSFLLYSIERNWNQIVNLIQTKHDVIAQDLVNNAIDLAIENDEMAVVAKCLQEMPHSFHYNFYPSFEYLETSKLNSFIVALKNLDLHFWVIQVYLHLSKWSNIEKCLVKSQYQTPEIVSSVITFACNEFYLDNSFIKTVLLLCFSFPEPLLKKLDTECIKKAFALGICIENVILVKSVISYVDLEHRYLGGSYLDLIIDEMSLNLCPRNQRAIMRLFISAGISTFHRSFEMAQDSWRSRTHIMTQLLPRNDSLGHLKLLHRSGLCSNKRLFELYEEYSRCYDREKRTGKQAHLIKNVPVEMKEKVQEYLHFAASNPLSLLDLARLTVSHEVGALPGRKERIEALLIPSYTKYLLNFSDLIAVAEQDEELENHISRLASQTRRL